MFDQEKKSLDKAISEIENKIESDRAELKNWEHQLNIREQAIGSREKELQGRVETIERREKALNQVRQQASMRLAANKTLREQLNVCQEKLKLERREKIDALNCANNLGRKLQQIMEKE